VDRQNRDGDGDESDRNVEVHGLSVSHQGFVVLLLEPHSKCILPVRIDRVPGLAQSPEALTLLQLFQGIDMAGAMLPPNVLSLRYAERVDLAFEFNEIDYTFNEASEWLRARANLPTIELLRVSIRPGSGSKGQAGRKAEPQPPQGLGAGVGVGSGDAARDYEGPDAVEDDDVAVVNLNEGFMFDLQCSRTSGALSFVAIDGVSAFEAIALAMRHKATCSLSVSQTVLQDFGFPVAEIPVRFPNWQSKDEAAAQSSRLTQRLMSAYTMNRLEGALRVARRLGDKAAEEKILAELGASYADESPIREPDVSPKTEDGSPKADPTEGLSAVEPKGATTGNVADGRRAGMQAAPARPQGDGSLQDARPTPPEDQTTPIRVPLTAAQPPMDHDQHASQEPTDLQTPTDEIDANTQSMAEDQYGSLRSLLLNDEDRGDRGHTELQDMPEDRAQTRNYDSLRAFLLGLETRETLLRKRNTLA